MVGWSLSRRNLLAGLTAGAASASFGETAAARSTRSNNQRGLSVWFGCYAVVVGGRGIRYDRVRLTFVDGTTRTFDDGYSDLALFSHEGYRGETTVPIHRALDFGQFPDTAPAHETYGTFHGPITEVTVDRGSDRFQFRAEPLSECVTDVEFTGTDATLLTQTEPPPQVDVIFRYVDGSYQQFTELTLGDDDTTITGRCLDRVFFTGPARRRWLELPNPNSDCQPTDSRRTSFSCTEVTLLDGVWGGHELNRPYLRLYFTDGTFQQFDATSQGFPDSFPMSFAGTGRHDGKTIEAVWAHSAAENGVSWYLTNPSVDECGTPTAATFEVLSTSENATLSYRFTVDGEVSPASADGNSADVIDGGEWADTISQNDDGTVTVTGRTGNREGDVFTVTGEILTFERTRGGSDYRLELDDRNITGRLR